ncbi:MAG: lipoprotein [Bacillota bacterium]
MLNKFLFALILTFSLSGCGVKGSPLPPLNPPPLGRGEPTYSETTKKDLQKRRTYKDQNSEDSSSGGSGL